MDILLETHHIIRRIIAPDRRYAHPVFSMSIEACRELDLEELRTIITTQKIK